MKCLFCGDIIVEKIDAKPGEWRYAHTSSTLDHPATLQPEPMTEAAFKEKKWFETWGFRRTTRSINESMNAQHWFSAGFEAGKEWQRDS